MIRICVFILLAVWQIATAQSPERTRPEYREVIQTRDGGYIKSPLLFRPYAIRISSDSFRVYLIQEFQYDFLQFIQEGEEFRAEGQIEVSIRDLKARKSIDHIFTFEVQEKNFRETNRKDRYWLKVDSLQLPGGSYQIDYKYQDKNARRRFTIQKKIWLPPDEHFYAASPLFLYADKSRPLLNAFSHAPSAFKEFWEFNTPAILGLSVWQADSTRPTRIFLVLRNDKHQQDLLTLDTLLTTRKRIQILEYPLPLHLLPEGRHELKVTYFYDSDSLEMRWPITIAWFSKPRSLLRREVAYEVMKYLMDEEAYKQFNKASRTEKESLFQDYWKERDPTPETPYNELMVEFFSRVDSADVKWGRKRQPGWQTDIGRIYILYGHPDEVDDHSLDPIPNPYLKWIYHLENHRLIVTFQAINGRKEYKLVKIEEIPS